MHNKINNNELSISGLWTNLNAGADNFIQTAQQSINKFSKSHPKLASIIKAITAIASLAIAFVVSPFATTIGLGLGIAVGLAVPRDTMKEVKRSITTAYNDHTCGLAKIALLAFIVFTPVILPATFGFVRGAAAGNQIK